MLAKAITISRQYRASFVEIEPSLPTLGDELGTHEVRGLRTDHATHVKGLRLLGGDVGHLRPLTLLKEGRLLFLGALWCFAWLVVTHDGFLLCHILG